MARLKKAHEIQTDKKKNPSKYAEHHVITEDIADKYPKMEVGEPIPSQTVQGQSMTIKELFKRHQEGQLIKQRRYQYLDVESIESLEEFEYRRPNLDFTDLQKLAEANANRQKQLEEQIEISKKIKSQAEKELQKDLDGDGKIDNPPAPNNKEE